MAPAPPPDFRIIYLFIYFFLGGGRAKKNVHFCKGTRGRCIGVLGVFWGHLGSIELDYIPLNVTISLDFFPDFSHKHDGNI